MITSDAPRHRPSSRFQFGSLWLASTLAACASGPQHAPTTSHATNVAALEDVPASLLEAPGTEFRGLVTREGTTYLVLEHIRWPEPSNTHGLEVPACWTDWAEGCLATLPVPASIVAELGAVPTHLSVLGAAGPCDARVGEVVAVDTHGCESSLMFAAPLTGCEGPLAPVGRADAAFDPELRWLAAPATIATLPFFGEPNTFTDPLHRATIEGWRADPEIYGNAPHDGLTARVSIDAGGESLESIVASFLVGNDEDRCQWMFGRRERVGLRRGRNIVGIDVPPVWDGALAWRGRIVGVVSGSPTQVRIDSVRLDATATVFETRVWSDNDECGADGWAEVELPCGL